MRILHFADAHIDMANYGRHDPASGLPLRVLDFLKSLDTIVNTAIEERVDLVLFAGDAYKDRTPAPTFQREWGKRIMRLSQARVFTLLLIGNHDVSPAYGRAHAIQEFDTLQVPFVRVIDRPSFLGPDDLWGMPLQVIAIPWIARSGLMAYFELSAEKPEEIYQSLEERIAALVEEWLERADPTLPIVFTAHASVEGAAYGAERLVMLGNDFTLSGGLVKNPRFNYVALGHIHKPQDVNQGQQPPVVYPGSIERIDFGEAQEERCFVIAHIAAGQPTRLEWRPLQTRPFVDRRVRLQPGDAVTETLLASLPSSEALEGAIVRLVIEYPRTMDALIDDAALRRHAERAFEFHLVKRPQIEARVRLPHDQTTMNTLTPLELLELYWRATNVEDAEALQALARQLLSDEETPPITRSNRSSGQLPLLGKMSERWRSW